MKKCLCPHIERDKEEKGLVEIAVFQLEELSSNYLSPSFTWSEKILD